MVMPRLLFAHIKKIAKSSTYLKLLYVRMIKQGPFGGENEISNDPHDYLIVAYFGTLHLPTYFESILL